MFADNRARLGASLVVPFQPTTHCYCGSILVVKQAGAALEMDWLRSKLCILNGQTCDAPATLQVSIRPPSRTVAASDRFLNPLPKRTPRSLSAFHLANMGLRVLREWKAGRLPSITAAWSFQTMTLEVNNGCNSYSIGFSRRNTDEPQGGRRRRHKASKDRTRRRGERGERRPTRRK